MKTLTLKTIAGLFGLALSFASNSSFAQVRVIQPVAPSAPQAVASPISPTVASEAYRSFPAFFGSNTLDNIAQLAQIMRDHVTPVEYQQFFLPLRTAASRASMILSIRGPLSQTTHEAFAVLLNKLYACRPLLERFYLVEAYYNTAVAIEQMMFILEETLR